VKKFAADRPFADPDVAARKIVEMRTASKPCRTIGFTSNG
jgi:hypothetical protein